MDQDRFIFEGGLRGLMVNDSTSFWHELMKDEAVMKRTTFVMQENGKRVPTAEIFMDMSKWAVKVAEKKQKERERDDSVQTATSEDSQVF